MSKAKIFLIALTIAWPTIAVFIYKQIEDETYGITWSVQAMSIGIGLVMINVKNLMDWCEQG